SDFQEAAPIEHVDAPSIKEAQEVCPSAEPRPLLIAEYRARTKKRGKPKRKRSGRKVKLLQQRRLSMDLMTHERSAEKLKEYQENLQDLNKNLTQIRL
ncbi:hypothetical protein KR200_006476, partial [Drosophila serrata]